MSDDESIAGDEADCGEPLSRKWRAQGSDILEFVPNTCMLDSGHQVPHSKGAQTYLEFNKAPTVLPSVAIERRIAKRFSVFAQKTSPKAIPK